MPLTDQRFKVGPNPSNGRWGTIRCGGPCKDDYDRINILQQGHAGDGRYVKLQQAALNSLVVVQDNIGFPVFVTGHGWRSCADQRDLHAQDPARYASADESFHCRGLAIDVDQSVTSQHLEEIHNALRTHDWFQSRPTSEPWHYSFGCEG